MAVISITRNPNVAKTHTAACCRLPALMVVVEVGTHPLLRCCRAAVTFTVDRVAAGNVAWWHARQPWCCWLMGRRQPLLLLLLFVPMLLHHQCVIAVLAQWWLPSAELLSRLMMVCWCRQGVTQRSCCCAACHCSCCLLRGSSSKDAAVGSVVPCVASCTTSRERVDPCDVCCRWSPPDRACR